MEEATRYGIPPHSRGEKFLSIFMIWALSKEPAYGYKLMSKVKNIGIMPQRPSTVYLVLSKLEKKGLIASRKEEAEGRMRKVYWTTQKGLRLFKYVKEERITGQLREFLLDLTAPI